MEVSLAHSENDGASMAAGGAAGVTELMIHAVVHAFYGKLRHDSALGPIFERVIGADWNAHMGKMCDFWSSVLLKSGRFRGAPVQAHVAIGDLRPADFTHWLHLFAETADETCPPEAAALFVAKSQMIAQSLQSGIALARSERSPSGTFGTA